VIAFDQLQQRRWCRQNDVVQEVFWVAAMVADLGSRAFLVDGALGQKVKAEAIASGDPIGYLNARCHAKSLKTRRMFVLDTTSTEKSGKSLHSRDRLHFHGIFEKPVNMKKLAFVELLKAVFGDAKPMGCRQLHIVRPDFAEGYSHKGVRGIGPIGKLFYALRHAGTTYNDLGYNGDNTHRMGPKERMSCNHQAEGLAKGSATNFNKHIVFCDSASKRAGKSAFDLWVETEKAAPVSAVIRHGIRTPHLG